MNDDVPIHILLVEDDPAHAELIMRNLDHGDLPMLVTHLADGQSALNFLYRPDGYAANEQAVPDLIVLDLRLPLVGGLEILQQIKADARLRHIPVVILTTSDSAEDMRSAYTYGAASYLVKPVHFERFAALIETFGRYWLGYNHYPSH